MKPFKIKSEGKDVIIGRFNCIVDYVGDEHLWANSVVYFSLEDNDLMRSEMTAAEIWEVIQEAQK